MREPRIPRATRCSKRETQSWVDSALPHWGSPQADLGAGRIWAWAQPLEDPVAQRVASEVGHHWRNLSCLGRVGGGRRINKINIFLNCGLKSKVGCEIKVVGHHQHLVNDMEYTRKECVKYHAQYHARMSTLSWNSFYLFMWMCTCVFVYLHVCKGL